jgi:hypothetical protein
MNDFDTLNIIVLLIVMYLMFNLLLYRYKYIFILIVLKYYLIRYYKNVFYDYLIR